MGKKILLAVDDSVYSEQAAKYAARISSAAKDVIYTLFNVQPLAPHILIERGKTGLEVKAEINELVRERAEAARCLVDRFKELMVSEGIPEYRVEAVTEPMQVGMVKDILNRAEQRRYDAIVLGRRGLTVNQACFIGATAAKVVEHALKFPVWIVAGKAMSMKMMLAVDGSENSFRAVDHVIHIVGANPDLRLTFFHVPLHLEHCYSVNATGERDDMAREKSRLQDILQDEDNRCMEDFYEKAYERLEAAGLNDSQIKIKTSKRSHDVSTAILDEAKAGQHSTLVVGRRGVGKAFFAGRMAMHLLQKVCDQTLWVVP